MGRRVHPPAKNPCGSCPYRQDVPSGVWAAEEYEKLPLYDLPTPEQPMAMFACHQQDGRACAGWVGTHDMTQSLSLRMGISLGTVAPGDVDDFLDYATTTPLFCSGEEAAEHGMRDIDRPGEKAKRTVEKLTKKLGDKVIDG